MLTFCLSCLHNIWSWSPEGSSYRSANSCDVAGTSCIGSCLSIGPFQQRGEGGPAAWVTAYPPYYFTQASYSREDTSPEHVTIASRDWRMPMRVSLLLKDFGNRIIKMLPVEILYCFQTKTMLSYVDQFWFSIRHVQTDAISKFLVAPAPLTVMCKIHGCIIEFSTALYFPCLEPESSVQTQKSW